MDGVTTASVISSIDSLGFPIVVCGVLFWFIKDILKRHSQMLDELNKTIIIHTETLKSLMETIKDKK